MPPRAESLPHNGRFGILGVMTGPNVHADILTEEFAQAAARAGLGARRNALAHGHAVVFVDDCGRYVEERPDGKRFEIRLEPGIPRGSHLRIVGELLGDPPAPAR